MSDSDLSNKEDVIEKVTTAALKYAMLRADVSKDVAFDMEESVSTSGDSGPYLLYIVARIKSLLEKAGEQPTTFAVPAALVPEEEALLLAIAAYPDATKEAVEQYDPSKISKYLFDLAQSFNSFYGACPIITDDAALQAFRLALSRSVIHVMEHGLAIIGIETVDRM